MVVPSGTTVRVRTKDCFGNQIQKPEDELDGIDWDHTNPATGPIFVEGAVPGGALKVSVDAIEFDNKSVSCTGENEGVCGDRFNAWSTQVCEIDGDELVWDERLRIPLRPMIGVIGVAPEAIRSIAARRAAMAAIWTTRLSRQGLPLLPRLRRWGTFGCGDMHAVMGDGEISSSGAEAAGWATVTLHGDARAEASRSADRECDAFRGHRLG